MTQLKLNSVEILLVRIMAAPKPFVKDGYILYGVKRCGMFSIKLPPGSWRLLGSGKASELSDDEICEIVEHWDTPTGGDDYQDYYKNYSIEKDEDYMHSFHFMEPKLSLESLLAVYGYSIKTTVVLIKE